MDSARFDTFVRVLAARRPRRAALPLLAALGLGLAEAGEVGKAKKKDEKAIRICVCADANPSTCKTQKKDKDKAKKTLRRNPCAYRGPCTGVSGCATLTPLAPNPGFQCTNNNDCTGGLVCIGQTCQACTDTRQCSGNQVCLNGTCQTPGPGPGPVCPVQCPFCEVCNPATGQCEVCPQNCRFCFTLADRTTVCGDSGEAFSCDVGLAGCQTSADCIDPDFHHCVASFTELVTNEVKKFCALTPNVQFLCTRIDPCA